MRQEIRYLGVNILIGLLIVALAFSVELYLGDYVEGSVPAREQLPHAVLLQLAFVLVPLVIALLVALVSLQVVDAWHRVRRLGAIVLMLCIGLLTFLVLMTSGNPRFAALSLAASVVFGATMRLPSAVRRSALR